MSSVHNSVETVNAAASAIATADTRVQPSTIQKRRWASCWSFYWCFGSYKNSKRIGHAVLVPESTAPGAAAAPVADNVNHSSSIVIPFIAPPSSPASFLQSDPPSASHSPAAGLLSLTSLSMDSCSPGGTASIFATGPYADETQLVSPPVFSAFTTEPSTACYTPTESVQFTTPSSPEVPFSQLLTSSLARSRRNSAPNIKFPLSQYEYQPYQYPGSPSSHLISPGSAISNSGTSSPFLDKQPIIEFRMGEAPKVLGYDHFTYKWGSRVGSGSLTPSGWGSRLGSGTLTPNGGISRLGSGSLTPNGGLSRLDSGSLTPNGGEIPSGDSYFLENQISEVASLANSDNGSENKEELMEHRVSFELTGEHVLKFDHQEAVPVDDDTVLESVTTTSTAQAPNNCQSISKKSENCCCEYCSGQIINEEKALGEEGKQCSRKQQQHTVSLGSSKDFNFDSTKQELPDKSAVEKWTFFPMLQPGVS